MLKIHFRKLNLTQLRSIAIAFSSGIVMGLATAPLNWWGLAWVALIPLWVMVSRQSPLSQPTGSRWRFNSIYLLPLAWGIAYHGLALSWITGLHPLTWMGVPWVASIAIALFCWGFITLWGAAIVVIWTWGVRQLLLWDEGDRSSSPALSLTIRRVLIATALWCGLEWIWSLGSLYWTSLSYTQSPGNVVILHLGQLSGPTVVTAAIVAVNGLLAEAWMNYRGQRLVTSRWQQLFGIAAILVIGLSAIGGWLYSRPLGQAPEAALKVGVIQGNVPTRIKLSAAGVRRAIDGYVSGYEMLAAQGVDAVLTPEGALPLLWNGQTANQNPFDQAVVDQKVVAWLGTFFRQDDRITQSLLTLTTQGEVFSRYNKIKLVPLGEYIPFQEILGAVIGRLSPMKTSMQPGTAAQRFDTPFGRAIASICYESAFPELFRAQAASGGEFILTASNLDPYSEVLMAQHEAQDLMRAIETDRWAVRATNTGYSGVIDPHGRIVWRSQPHEYQIHTETIARRQTQTLYVRWGDWLTPGLIGLGGSWLVVSRWVQNRK
ncbi:apolipoprotein N-acyltransferase [Pantanalinema sp. GBBB05]|uniref:apolipoprotein N-acyltransferase n=1 Tax=Pantanalinema sp. GBBB05 TaxID=2604139 RepID=UPI001DDABF2D|nr:apolipoprotein N-acyltransferase [Pantanalinema sp. GBBB05]